MVITDPAGNESEPSDPYTIIIDTTAPAVPTLNSVVDDQGTVTGDLASGDTTDDARPDLSGTAEPGSIVTIYDNGVAIGSVRATDGTWTFTPPLPLSNGPHTLTVTASDDAGNVSAPTPGFDLNVVAGGVPPAPAIITVVDDQGLDQGPLAQNDFTDDAQPTINGTGADGTIISIFANGVLLGTAPVVNGQWTFIPPTPLPEGLNNLTALAVDSAGNPGPATGDYPINVDTVAPVAPTGQSLTDDVGDVTGPILSGSTTDDANPTFSGMAEAGAVVFIYDNGNLIGSTRADLTTGAWSFTPPTPLVDGPHSFAAQAEDSAGNRSPMGPSIPFTVDTSVVVISITGVEDNVGTITGNLTSGQTTDDATPTLSGKATPGGIVSIYDGTTLLGTETADLITGEWSFTTPELADGSHSLKATVTTPANGESAPTPVFDAIIDTSAPLAPSIGAVTDDVGLIQGPVADGGSTDDTTPTLTGDGLQFGDVVKIYDNGQLIGSAPVKSDGSWSYTPTTPLNDDEHEFTVIAVDPAGNESAPSAPWTIDIDTSAPIAAAVVESMGKDSGSDSNDFKTNDGSAGRLIQGSLTAAIAVGDKVQVSTDGGLTWGDASVNNLGGWSFVDPNNHASDWGIQTRVVNLAGNATEATQEVSLDTAAPDVPTAISRSGDALEVSFSNAGLVAGDSLSLSIGEYYFTHVLTSAEVASGLASAAIPSEILAITSSASSTSAAIVDAAGNRSNYLKFSAGGVELFDDDVFDDSILKSVTGPSYINEQGWVVRSGGSNTFTLEEASSKVSVTYGSSNQAGNLVQFFNSAGVLLYAEALAVDPTNTEIIYRTITFQAPPGETIAYFTMALGRDGGTLGVAVRSVETSPLSTEVGPTEINVDLDSGGVFGGATNDVFNLTDVSYFNGSNNFIDGALGVDVLNVTGANQLIDLNVIGEKLSSVEVIDITGSGNNTLSLSLGDVLEQGGTSLFTGDESTQMMIKGNAGDIVNLDDLLPDGTDPGDWASAGTATVAGVTYNVYQHSTLDAQLLVQDGVTTNLV